MHSHLCDANGIILEREAAVFVTRLLAILALDSNIGGCWHCGAVASTRLIVHYGELPNLDAFTAALAKLAPSAEERQR